MFVLKALLKRSILLPFFLAILLMAGVSVLSWALLGGGVFRQPQRIEYLIPQGTAQRVLAGEAVPSIPVKAVFVVGDTLVLNNQDKADFQMGPFWIPAGTVVTVPLDRVSTFNYICNFHPSGYIGLEVRPRDSLLQELLPTLILGIPIGALLSITTHVMLKLDTA